MSTMAERIRERRLARGMTQQELGARCGISAPSVNAWESGKTTAITGANLLAAAKTLQVNPEWLLTGDGPADLSQSQSGRPDRTTLQTAIQVVEEVLHELQITYPPKQRADLVMGCYLALEAGQQAASARTFVAALLEAQAIKR